MTPRLLPSSAPLLLALASSLFSSSPASSPRAQATLVRAITMPAMDGPVAWEPNTGEAHAVEPGSPTIWRYDAGRWVPVTTPMPAPSLASARACTWPGHGLLLAGAGQTWLFDGATWTRIPTASAPTAAMRALAFDHARGVVVAVAEAVPLQSSQTWEFDGASWTQRIPTSTPPTLPLMVMAWDAQTQRCVLRVGNPTANAFFVWDGTAWTQHPGLLNGNGSSLATSPGGGVLAAGGYDFPFAGRTFVWRQATGYTLVDQFANAPAQREVSTSWFDPVRNETVVTNVAPGNRGSWHWNGTAWSRPVHGFHLPERTDAFAYDSWRGRVLAYGGMGILLHPHGELWQLAAGAPAFLGQGPSPRSATAVTFDSRRGRLIVFGGANSDPGGVQYYPPPDNGPTYEWDGATWTAVPPTSWPSGPDPRFRVNAAIAFDRARGKTVMFGGSIVTGAVWFPPQTNHTFEWDGATWTAMQPATVPPVASAPWLVFDPELGKCVLFTNTTAWTWDGTDWTQLVFSAPPSGGPYRPYLDEARGRWVAFGSTQTWERVNGAWQQLPFAGTSGPMAFDLAQGAFAGSDRLGAFTYGDPAAATLRPFGAGCAGSAGVPVLHGEDAPRLGRQLVLDLAQAPAGAPFVGMLGADAPSWLGLPLPIDLTPAGMPGCTLHTAIDAHELRVGTTRWPIGVPTTPALLGNRYRAQAFVFDAAANPLGATTSNALELRIGS